MIRRSLRALALAAVATCFAAVVARAGTFTIIQGAADVAPTALPPFSHWDLRQLTNCEVPYALGALTVDIGAAAATTGVDNAFGVWQAVEPAVIRYRNVGNVVATSAADNQNVIFWDNNLCSGDPWDAGLRGGSIGITAIRHNAVTGVISDQDIVLDDEHFDWNNGVQNAPQSNAGDDVAAIQTLGDGSRRVVISTGANGICETHAVCGDVQLVPVGVNAGANVVAIRPAAAAVLPPAAPTPLAGTAANLAGTMDVWTICAHEIGHFSGLGENNAAFTGANVDESLNNGPFNVPGGATLNFTINGNAVAVALTAGAARTAAQIAADINAAIAAQQPGAGAAQANPAGSVEIRATAANQPVIVTGGTATGLLGYNVGESGMSTMNQNDRRGLTSLDQRTLSRHDTDGLNFLYSPDLGDAPDNINAGNPNNLYPVFVHSGTAIPGAGGMLNGVQLNAPGIGPDHLFGFPPNQFEWLGASVDNHRNECDARVTDQDQFDDGMTIPGGKIEIGQTTRVSVLVSTNNPGGRYAAGNAARSLYFNGYFDKNGDQRFAPAERVIWWNGVPGTTAASSPNFVPGASNLGANPMVLAFDVNADSTWSPGVNTWARARLDLGQDEGRVSGGGTIDSLGAAVGAAQFGEVEDYPYHQYFQAVVARCPPVASGDNNNPASLQFCVENLTAALVSPNYKLIDRKGWIVGDSLLGGIGVGANATSCITASVRPPADCTQGEVDTLIWIVTPSEGVGSPDTCYAFLSCTSATPTLVSTFRGQGGVASADLEFVVTDPRGVRGVHIYRAPLPGGAFERVTAVPIVLDGHGSGAFTDDGLASGTRYAYELGILGADGLESRSGHIEVATLKLEFALGAPYPNPAAHGFSVRLSMPAKGAARVRLLDLSGRIVATVHDGLLDAGQHTLTWDGRTRGGRDVGPGIYFIEYVAGSRRAVERVVVMR